MPAYHCYRFGTTATPPPIPARIEAESRHGAVRKYAETNNVMDGVVYAVPASDVMIYQTQPQPVWVLSGPAS